MPFRGDERLLLAQNQVHNPTTSDMLPFLTAVAEDVGVEAPRFFESVGQHRQAVEGPLDVDGQGDMANRSVVPGQDGSRRRKRRVEGIAEYITKQHSLGSTLAARTTEGVLSGTGSMDRD